MRFELKILGSGSALPVSNRNTTAQVLNVLERFFLIDCGEGVQNTIRNLKIPFGKIDHIFISHLHGDHFYGIFGLISTFSLLGRTNDLHIYAPGQLDPLLKKVLDVQDSNPPYKIVFHQLNFDHEELIFEDDKVTVHSFPLRHSAPVCGFVFREKPRKRKIEPIKLEQYKLSIAEINALKCGKDIFRDGKQFPNSLLTIDPLAQRSYAFVTDTVPIRKTPSCINHVDVLYHESTFLKSEMKLARKTAHSTAYQAAKIAQQVDVDLLLLGHYSARYSDVLPFETEAKEVFFNTVAVLDGDEITWPDQNKSSYYVYRNGHQLVEI